MAVHLADRPGGTEFTRLEDNEGWIPDEPSPAPTPDPAPGPPAPADHPTAWLHQLPPLNLPAELGHTATEWGVPADPSSLLDLPAPEVTAPAPTAAPAPAFGATSSTNVPSDTSPSSGNAVSGSDATEAAGDRSADYAFMARSQARVEQLLRVDAWQQRINDITNRLNSEELLARPASGSIVYANEIASQSLNDELWALMNAGPDGSDPWAWDLADSHAGASDYRNGSDIDSDAYSPVASDNHRNGSDVASDGSRLRDGHQSPRTSAVDGLNSLPATIVDPAPTQVTITGTRLPTDAQGNQLDVRPNGEAVIWLQSGGIVSLGSISPELAAELSSPAVLLGALPTRLATGATAATLADGLAMVVRTGAAVVEATPELGLRAIGTAGALLAFGGSIPGDNVVELGAGLRFFGPDGSTLGTVQERQPNGNWEVVRENATLVEVMGRYVALTPQELGQAQAPMITVQAPQTPSGPPALPAWADRPETPPPYQTAEPAGPQATATPAQPVQDWRDLLIQQDARALGEALIAANRPKPGAGYVPHHIVQRSGGGADMAAARARLSELGIDLDHEANGAWLPGHRADQAATGAYHERVHNDDYREAVVNLLRDVSSKEEGLALLRDIGKQLEDGAFTGVRPRPGSGEGQP